jgi:hypothetical protein
MEGASSWSRQKFEGRENSTLHQQNYNIPFESLTSLGLDPICLLELSGLISSVKFLILKLWASFLAWALNIKYKELWATT